MGGLAPVRWLQLVICAEPQPTGFSNSNHEFPSFHKRNSCLLSSQETQSLVLSRLLLQDSETPGRPSPSSMLSGKNERPRQCHCGEPLWEGLKHLMLTHSMGGE